MGHLLEAGEGKWSLPTEWSLGGKVEGRLGYTTGKNLSVSSFLLAVILVSGFQTAVQSQLLTVWAAVWWWKRFISPTEVLPSLLHGIVSKKKRKNAIGIFFLRSFDSLSSYHSGKDSDLVFHEKT